MSFPNPDQIVHAIEVDGQHGTMSEYWRKPLREILTAAHAREKALREALHEIVDNAAAPVTGGGPGNYRKHELWCADVARRALADQGASEKCDECGGRGMVRYDSHYASAELCRKCGGSGLADQGASPSKGDERP